MDKQDWIRLAKAAKKTPWLRPWPDEKQALTADGFLVEGQQLQASRTPKNPTNTTITSINARKMRMAIGKPREPDQKGVMGASATTVRVKFHCDHWRSLISNSAFRFSRVSIVKLL